MRLSSWFVALVLAGVAGPASAATVFSDDVEAGAGGWSATGMWHRVVAGGACAEAHGGAASWYYGLAATCTYDDGAANSGTLTSPEFAVPAGSTWVDFWSFSQTEGGTYYDRRLVEVSVDGGPYQDVAQVTDPFLSWQYVRVDLSAHAGHTLRVRFLFETRDGILNGYRGWYVDDVRVESVPAQYLAGSDPFDWIDVAIPANDTAMACDDCQVTRAIGFPFTFYGQGYTTVNVGSNGYITFAGPATYYSNARIPAPSPPDAFAAPFWDDLYVSGSAGKVYAATVGSAPHRKFVVTWRTVDFYRAAGPITFQVVLSEGDNTITFQYQSIASASQPARGLGGEATVGLENVAGTGGVQYSYNQAVLSDGLAITYLADSDGDGVSDRDEQDLGTDPYVSQAPPLLVTLSGPGTTFGTVDFRFEVGGAPVGTTQFRVYYGARPGVTTSDYPAHFDVTDLAARSGTIDQRWGMQGVPMVYFRIAPVRSLGGHDFVGELSNEHAAYFAGASPKQSAETAGTTVTDTRSSGCSSGGAGVLGLLLVAAARWVGLHGASRRRPPGA